MNTAPHRLSRGMSLVELMVGVVVGLFVVAAATVLVTGQLRENRLLLLETQLQQDLRAAADIVTRELRRAGARANAWDGIWSPNAAAQHNPLSAISTNSGTVSDLTYSYSRRAGEFGPWRFVLQGGVIRVRPQSGTLQDLTDGNVMVVDTFNITVQPATSVRLPCPTLCPGGTVDCWPRVTVREYLVEITARAKHDANVRRSVRSTVRQRNDWVEFLSPGTPPTACPA